MSFKIPRGLFLSPASQVVVLTDSPFDVALTINDFCHANNIRFLSTQSRGVFGNIFVDFGTNFVIYDSNGETPTSAMVSAITQVITMVLAFVLAKLLELVNTVNKRKDQPDSVLQARQRANCVALDKLPVDKNSRR